MARVIISAGHTSTDPGTVVDGLREVDFARKIAKEVTKSLRDAGIITLAVPYDLDLAKRINWINNSGYKAESNDLFIEIHINEGGKSGVEAWFLNEENKNSRSLASSITGQIAQMNNLTTQGVRDEREHPFGGISILQQTKPLGVLIECLYIDNPEDQKFLRDDNKIAQLGVSIAKGIADYLNINFKAVVKNSGNKSNSQSNNQSVNGGKQVNPVNQDKNNNQNDQNKQVKNNGGSQNQIVNGNANNQNNQNDRVNSGVNQNNNNKNASSNNINNNPVDNPTNSTPNTNSLNSDLLDEEEEFYDDFSDGDFGGGFGMNNSVSNNTNPQNANTNNSRSNNTFSNPGSNNFGSGGGIGSGGNMGMSGSNVGMNNFGGGSLGSGLNKPQMTRDERKDMINKYYQKAFGKEPSQNDLNYFINISISEDQFLKRILESQEHVDLVNSAKQYNELKVKYDEISAKTQTLDRNLIDQRMLMDRLNTLLAQKNAGLTQMQRKIQLLVAKLEEMQQSNSGKLTQVNYKPNFLDRIFYSLSKRLS